MTADFSGLWIPLITPFKNDGALDLPALKNLVKHYAACGVSGFVVCGSTGEAAALDDDEQLEVLRAVLGAGTDLPVVMGVSSYHLGQTLGWVKTLVEFPLAGILLPAPHYIRPSQAGLLTWFRAIADAAPAPVIVYDIPYRTGVNIDTETLLALAAHSNIRAIKDCGGDLGKTQSLIADGRLQVLAGDDANIFATLAQGGVGAIAASAHVWTSEFVAVIRALRAGDLALARTTWAPLPQLIAALFAEPNPASIKAALAHQGWTNNELRAPMMRASLPLHPLLSRPPRISQDAKRIAKKSPETSRL